ncbi:MAG: hypothetical protein R3B70_34315 [Polyangiaceae bacterium]
MARRFSLTLQATRGKIHDFSATVGGKLVLEGDATQARSYVTNDLPEHTVEVRVIANGTEGSQYKIALALPGKEEGFLGMYTLAAPVQSIAFRV